jgi:hypothetical protein
MLSAESQQMTSVTKRMNAAVSDRHCGSTHKQKVRTVGLEGTEASM